MKINLIGNPQIIMSNPNSKHNYFGWPTVAKLQDGTIAVVASGFRLRHVCPFGKTVISYSRDNGETYTLPAPVIDTVLDDRDGGVVPFGQKSVIVTSFNNTLEQQREWAIENGPDHYALAYVDSIPLEEEAKYLGSTYRVSHDYGVTFGEIKNSPVTSPHGPVELPDGALLWVGNDFTGPKSTTVLKVYRMEPDGTVTYLSEIEKATWHGQDTTSYEPHTILLDDGTLLTHIRVHCDEVFTTYQTESTDGGKTWTTPHQIIDDFGGSPAHILKHSSGVLISTYGHRHAPFGIKAMFSKDGGKTWDSDYDLYITEVSPDLGYPSTIEMEDGSLLTVFYAKESIEAPAVIFQQKWRFEDI